MKPETENNLESTFIAYLRSMGMKRSRQRLTVLKVFLRTTEPLSGMELLYPVKQEDTSVSLSVVYDALKLMTACGIAREIPGENARASTRYVHGTITECSHRHLVCRDCGAVIEMEAQRESEGTIAPDRETNMA